MDADTKKWIEGFRRRLIAKRAEASEKAVDCRRKRLHDHHPDMVCAVATRNAINAVIESLEVP